MDDLFAQSPHAVAVHPLLDLRCDGITRGNVCKRVVAAPDEPGCDGLAQHVGHCLFADAHEMTQRFVADGRFGYCDDVDQTACATGQRQELLGRRARHILAPLPIHIVSVPTASRTIIVMSDSQQGLVHGIVVAGGKSRRMDGIDKIFAPLVGRPLIAWTLGAFKDSPEIDGVVVVAAPDSVDTMRALVREWRFTKVTAVVAGGDERQDSVRLGLEAAGGAAIVAVQDAARPLLTPALIRDGVAAARRAGAAVCAVPARDTVKAVDPESRHIHETLDRKKTWLAQTPQVFDCALLLEAHARAMSLQPDDAALVEALGHEVVVYEGATSNIKVTTREDLVLAEALLRARLES